MSFIRSKLDWNELEQEFQRDILAWHKELIRLRRRFPALGCANLHQTQVTLDEDKQWLHIKRTADKYADVMILCNFSKEPQGIPLLSHEHLELLASSFCGAKLNMKTATVPASSAVIIKAAGTE
jgi:maltooligosyltrehalose trehalohydrolase